VWQSLWLAIYIYVSNSFIFDYIYISFYLYE
jgi:hypothetical protein